MKNVNDYLTPQDYADAELNGVSKNVARNRFYNLGWSKKRTISTAPTRDTSAERTRWRQIAERNGIPRSTFNDRVCNSKWPLEKAATTPVMNKKERAEQARKSNYKVFTEEEAMVAESYGIPLSTARHRVRQYGWTVHRAITTPVNTAFRSKAYGKEVTT